MNNAQLINQDSGQVEWYTPTAIIEAARLAMGGIDLDPASCESANQRVKAAHIFTKDDDGLSRAWFGNVWMNHPYGDRENACRPQCTKKRCVKRGYCITQDQPGNEDWINKIVYEYRAGNIDQACAIMFASTSEGWFQPLYDYPLCFTNQRIRFVKPDGAPGDSPTKGSVIVYLGSDIDSFVTAFGKCGRVMVPAKAAHHA